MMIRSWDCRGRRFSRVLGPLRTPQQRLASGEMKKCKAEDAERLYDSSMKYEVLLW
jgi:hypothetical protein